MPDNLSSRSDFELATEIVESALLESDDRSITGFHASVLQKLLRFCAFTEEPVLARPYPFDDPYVGAILVDQDFRVVGAHRKRTNQERHAEPNAIVDALVRASKQAATATQLTNEIEAHYDNKSWLQSDKKVIEFERCFANAGDFLRNHFRSSKLFLYSTLEPCRDYETQPSCSCIICAVGMDEVFYASDDANAKGQGRRVIETGRDPAGRLISSRNPPIVHANLCIAEALSVNRLFFTTNQVVQRFFHKFDVGQSWIAPAYSPFRLDRDYSLASTVKGRIELLPRPEVLLPIYQVASPQFGLVARASDNEAASSKKLSAIREAEIDTDLVLMLKHVTEDQLIEILFDRVSHDLKLPAILIATQTMPVTEGSDLDQSLRQKQVKRFAHCFRKQDEQFTAQQHVVLSAVRQDLADFLYILVKYASPQDGSEPYATSFALAAEAVTHVRRESKKPSRITIYTAAKNWSRVGDFLAGLNSLRVFRPTGNLAQTSFDIRLCSLAERENTEDYAVSLIAEVEKQMLSYRVKVSSERLSAALSAAHVRRLLTELFVDPTFFSRDFFKDLATSLDWKDRRSAGMMLAEVISREPSMSDAFILSEIESILDNGLSRNSWAPLCTHLNALQDFAHEEEHIGRELIKGSLIRTLDGISTVLKAGTPNPWFLDVLWRWTACWAKYERDSERYILAITNPTILTPLTESPFLFSQFVYYTIVGNDPAAGTQRLHYLFSKHRLKLSRPVSEATSTMLGRLSFAFEFLKEDNVSTQITEVAHALDLESVRGFHLEKDRCAIVWTDRLARVETAETDEEKGRAFATLTNLRTLIPAVRRDSLKSQEVNDELDQKKTWRGDQTGAASEALLELSSGTLICAIRGMVTDADVSTRWGGLSYTFGPRSLSLVEAVAPDRSKEQLHNLREIRKEFACAALKVDRHYWLEREILSHYAKARSERNLGELSTSRDRIGLGPGMPSLSRLPIADTVLLESFGHIHPEVELAAKQYRKAAKRIALLLPPLFRPADRPTSIAGGTINYGSPPLGLGQIAASLASEGHFVEIIDAHRFSISHQDLVTSLARFDVVGINVVISTMQSVRMITRDLKAQSPKTQIVIGGPAPTLLSMDQIEESGISFDFLVEGAGERAFVKIANGASEHHAKDGDANIVDAASLVSGRENSDERNSISRSVTRRTSQSKSYQGNWSLLPWTDRDQFVSPSGASQYEPTTTRDGSHREVHVVLSRGCDWGCSFCTEALVGGLAGEMRREVEDVVSELRHILWRYGASGIQFVDDNIFPPRPTRGRSQDKSTEKLAWTTDFLKGLGSLREEYLAANGKELSWRGLMRIEDFLEYEKINSNFLGDLESSGCNLLAFGIESGVESHRWKLKGSPNGKPTNEQIQQIIVRLRGKGIRSKGYFMLSGPGQSNTDAQATIDFAIAADFDLAYFAIFKEFRAIASKNQVSPNPTSFRLFTSELASALAQPNEEALWNRIFGKNWPAHDRNSMSAEFTTLSNLGFSFANMIKYNDYHADDDLYELMGFLDSTAYLQMLSSAYAEFYCRPNWSDRYKRLIEAGY